MSLEHDLDALAADQEFSGVVWVDRAGEIELAKAYGWAHRGWEIPNQVDTRFGIASGSKGFTALTVISLIEDGVFDLSTAARSFLGSDLPLIRDDVTIEHLLSHRSGIGDYLDEDAGYDLNDYMMPIPVQDLVITEDFVAVLDGFPMKSTPGEMFSYCNGGFVVLALIAERASGAPFHDLVSQRVLDPAGMSDTEFLRSDQLPGDTALGYYEIDGVLRTNVFHLPVRGTGDGGIYTTAADVSVFWKAFFAGRIVSTDWVAEMLRPRSEVPDDSRRYGLGFWLHESTDTVMLTGSDTGASFLSVHEPHEDITHTVISNITNGAWAVTSFLREQLGL